MFPFPTFCPSAKRLVLIDRTSGTNFGDMLQSGGTVNGAFDGVSNTSDGSSNPNLARKGQTLSAYVGKSLNAGRVFGKAVVYGSNNLGYKPLANQTITLTMYGKNGSAPSSRVDGTELGSVSFVDTLDESGGRSISSSDLTTKWDHLWVGIVASGGSTYALICAELELYAWE